MTLGHPSTMLQVLEGKHDNWSQIQSDLKGKKQFYENLVNTKQRESKLEKLQFVGRTVFPLLIISFSSMYFMYGFSNVYLGNSHSVNSVFGVDIVTL